MIKKDFEDFETIIFRLMLKRCEQFIESDRWWLKKKVVYESRAKSSVTNRLL